MQLTHWLHQHASDDLLHTCCQQLLLSLLGIASCVEQGTLAMA
jgi:hypothetical protein